MNEKHQQILQRHSHTLTTRLVINEVFISQCEAIDLITPAMSESIMAEGSDTEKASKFLNYLRRGGPNAFRNFVYVLQRTGPDWLAAKLTDAEEIVNAEGEMCPERTARLQQFRQEIMSIQLNMIWNRVDHIFSPMEEVQIQTQTKEKQIATLLDILSSKSDIAFDHLVRALQTDHRELAGRLVHGTHEEEKRHEIPGKLDCLRLVCLTVRLTFAYPSLDTNPAKPTTCFMHFPQVKAFSLTSWKKL